MVYTEPLTLIKLTPTKDSIGNVYNTEVKTNIYAKKNVVGSKEFYNAVAVGITPTAELQIKLSNYNGEQEVEYLSKRYSVIRVVPKGKADIVLVIGLKQGVKNVGN